jgi:DNA primase
MPIPQSVIDEVLSRSDIVQVISGYIRLQPAGRNFKALCPFHQEKTPSFIISPEKQLFNCFGCGIGGNIFSFLMKHERLNFMEALRLLAEKAGVALPEGKQEASRASELFELNRFAKDFFIERLKETPAAKDYLLRKRGLSPEVIEEFSLGYAPPDWDALLKEAKKEGFSVRSLSEAGLIIPRQGSVEYYDRFRGRIIFPIFNLSEKVVGFGGRALGEEVPSYINSPETTLYHKSNSLYGLHLSRKAISRQEEAIVVEGYIDVIALFQAGVKNVVGSLGTSLTREQLRLIRRYGHQIVIVYDSDDAGIEAALRGIDLSLAEGFYVRITSLPKGEDPDSFIRRYGKESFEEKVSCASDFLEYKIRLLEARYDPATIRGKALVVAEMLPTLMRVTNAVEKSGYVKRLAQELALREEDILAELYKLKGEEAHLARLSSPINTASHPAERSLIQIMLQHSDMIDRIKAEVGEFQNPDYRRIADAIFELSRHGRVFAQIVDILNDDRLGALASQLALESVSFENAAEAITDALRAMRNDERKRKMEELKKRIEDADREDNQELVKRLQAQCQQIVQEMVKHRK